MTMAVVTFPGTHFQLPPEVFVLGIISGLIYGLLGVGLTLVYRATRVINFAHGDVGALATGIMLAITVSAHLPYGLGLIAGLAAALLIGALMEFLVIRRLVRAPRLVVLVATIGVSQVLLAFNLLIPRQDFGS